MSCADKNYRFIDDTICTWTKLYDTAFLLAYPDLTQWLNRYNVEIETIDPSALPDAQTGARPITITMVEKTHILNANLQKQ